MTPCRIALPALCLLFSFVAMEGRGQSKVPAYELSFMAAGATDGPLPFWLHANRYGIFDQDGGNVATELKATIPFSGRKKLDYRAVADVLVRASDHSTAYIHQLFGQLRYGRLRFTAGRIERASDFVDTTLSMGAVTLSPNAPPIPRLSIALDYVPILKISGIELIHLTAYISNGILERDRFVERPFIHEKYLYLRGIGPADFPVLGHAGITHYVIWGGKHPTLGPLPGNFRDFFDVIFARAGDDDRAPEGEVVNALGNTIASYDFGLTLNVPGFDMKAYRQFYIETGANIRFRSAWDGLWGITFRFKDADRPIRGLLYEVANTKQQNARRDRGERNGRANYYNNFIYEAGWTYFGRTLGLPLLVSDGVHPGVVNNILLAHHAGVEGRIRGIDYRAFLTYSRNYGAVRACVDTSCSSKADARLPRTDQYSMLLETTGALLPHLHFKAALAVDTGALYPENVGLMVGLTWRSGGPSRGSQDAR